MQYRVIHTDTHRHRHRQRHTDTDTYTRMSVKSNHVLKIQGWIPHSWIIVARTTRFYSMYWSTIDMKGRLGTSIEGNYGLSFAKTSLLIQIKLLLLYLSWEDIWTSKPFHSNKLHWQYKWQVSKSPRLGKMTAGDV